MSEINISLFIPIALSSPCILTTGSHWFPPVPTGSHLSSSCRSSAQSCCLHYIHHLHVILHGCHARTSQTHHDCRVHHQHIMVVVMHAAPHTSPTHHDRTRCAHSHRCPSASGNTQLPSSNSCMHAVNGGGCCKAACVLGLVMCGVCRVWWVCRACMGLKEKKKRKKRSMGMVLTNIPMTRYVLVSHLQCMHTHTHKQTTNKQRSKHHIPRVHPQCISVGVVVSTCKNISVPVAEICDPSSRHCSPINLYACYCICNCICVCACVHLCVYMCIYVHLCVYMCTSVHLCVYMCTSVHLCVYMCTSVHLCVYMCISVHLCVYICTSVHLCVYMCTSVHLCVYMCISVHLCVYMCISVHLYIFMHSIHTCIHICKYVHIHTYPTPTLSHTRPPAQNFPPHTLQPPSPPHTLTLLPGLNCRIQPIPIIIRTWWSCIQSVIQSLLVEKLCCLRVGR